MSIFPIKKGSLLPKLRATLTVPSAIDWSQVTAVFRMRLQAGSTLKISNAPATLVSPTVSTSCDVDYPWTGTDTDTVGDYWGEFVCTLGGLPLIIPSSGFVAVKVEPTLP